MQAFRVARTRRTLRPAAFQPTWDDDELEAVLHAEPMPASASDSDVAASRTLQDAGNALAEAGHYAAALSEWRRAVKLTPRNALLHESMVRALLQACVLLARSAQVSLRVALSQAQAFLEIGETWRAVEAAQRASHRGVHRALPRRLDV